MTTTQPEPMTASAHVLTRAVVPGPSEDKGPDPILADAYPLPADKDPMFVDAYKLTADKGPELPAKEVLEEKRSLYRVDVHQKITRTPGGPEYHPPITKQPGTLKDSMFHPSLRKLNDVEGVTINQLCSNYCCFVKNSIYRVNDIQGNQMFTIKEGSSCGMRCCCGWCRSFKMRVLDHEENEMMTLSRPVMCGQCSCCCGNFCLPCCQTVMEVNSSQPPNRTFGKVRQNFSCCSPSFTCLNENGQPAFNVTGVCCRPWCKSHYFSAKTGGIAKGQEGISVGQIRKKWKNCLTECCTNAHQLNIQFEKMTSLEDRIMLLSSTILIDFLHYT